MYESFTRPAVCQWRVIDGSVIGFLMVVAKFDNVHSMSMQDLIKILALKGKSCSEWILLGRLWTFGFSLAVFLAWNRFLRG